MDCFVTGTEVRDLSCSFFMDESLKPDGPPLCMYLTVRHGYRLHLCMNTELDPTKKLYCMFHCSLFVASQPDKWFHHCCTWLQKGT